jgi:hypothetical protein
LKARGTAGEAGRGNIGGGSGSSRVSPLPLSPLPLSPRAPLFPTPLRSGSNPDGGTEGGGTHGCPCRANPPPPPLPMPIRQQSGTAGGLQPPASLMSRADDQAAKGGRACAPSLGPPVFRRSMKIIVHPCIVETSEKQYDVPRRRYEARTMPYQRRDNTGFPPERRGEKWHG